MTMIKLQFRSGVNRDITNYSGEGGWWACDKVRFKGGFPKKIGGWAKETPTSIYGVCRNMLVWTTTYSDNLLALGTNNKLYIESAGYYNDITPLRVTNPTYDTPDTDNCLSTTISSNVVVVALTGHGAETGDFITISGADAIGGIPAAQINTGHQITVINANSFSFTTTSNATSTVASGGGAVIIINFQLEPGSATGTYGYGWGTGTWGREAWGLGSTTPVAIAQRDWFLDNFDNDLVANIRNGGAYYWARGTNTDPAFTTPAIRLQDYADDEGFDASAVPVKVMQLMVSQQDKHLIAFGAVPYGSTNANDFDPLLIRWADQDTPGNWTPGVTTSAGDLRISRGSRIVRAIPSRQEILVFTDSNLYSLQFLGTTDVYGLQEYASNISIASPRAVATVSNLTVWMGLDKFYAYTGRAETLPCTISDYVFDNLNVGQSQQIVCGTNEEWDEVWWFYPSGDSVYNNAYVVFNYVDNIWYYGNLERDSWLDTPLRGKPLATNTSDSGVTSYLYSHETGSDADGAAMEAYIESNDFDVEDGEKYILTNRLIPDVRFSGSAAQNPEVTMEIRPRRFPGGAYTSDAADSQAIIQTSVDQYTEQVFIRARARQMAFKLMSTDLGVAWELGSPRIEGRLDGRR